MHGETGISLQSLWDLHGSDPAAVARLLEQEESLPAQASSSEGWEKWIGLATHVFVEHLFAPERLDAWAAALYAQRVDWEESARKRFLGVGLALERARPGVSLRLGEVEFCLSEAAISEASQSPDVILDACVFCLAEEGGVLRAEAAQACVAGIASALGDGKARGDGALLTPLARRTNNIATGLLEGDAASVPAPVLRFAVDLARISREAWLAIGNWQNEERADWLLARTLLRAGEVHEALAAAERGLAVVAAHGDDPLEKVFLLAARSLCWAAQGDPEKALSDRAAVRGILAAHPEEEWLPGEIGIMITEP